MIHWTEKYMGIPFKLHGRDISGLDCWGLVCLIYSNELKTTLPSYTEDYDNIDKKEDLKRLKELYDSERTGSSQNWKKIPMGKEKEFDVLLIPMAGMRTHVAICIEKGKMIHITDGTDVSIEDYTSIKWQRRFQRAIVSRHPSRPI